MNDATNNAKGTIADKIHQAVNSLLDTEMRLNTELNEARQLIRSLEDEKAHLRNQLYAEQQARKNLENLIGEIGRLVGSK